MLRGSSFVLLVLAAAVAAACRSSSSSSIDKNPAAHIDAAPPASSTAPAAEEACTGATALVPGIPGSPGHLVASERNPNGVSELAALMRVMESDMREARDRVHASPDDRVLDRGSTGGLWARHRKIRCAWPTQLGDRNAEFDVRAQAYLAQVRAFDTQADVPRYLAVLDACRTCHESTCTGALAAIDALKAVGASAR